MPVDLYCTVTVRQTVFILSIYQKNVHMQKGSKQPFNGFEPAAREKARMLIQTYGVPIAPHERATMPAVDCFGWLIYWPLHTTNPVKHS